MTNIKLDGKEYEIDKLSYEVKAYVQILKFTEKEIARLKLSLAAMQTARNAYADALKKELAKVD